MKRSGNGVAMRMLAGVLCAGLSICGNGMSVSAETMQGMHRWQQADTAQQAEPEDGPGIAGMAAEAQTAARTAARSVILAKDAAAASLAKTLEDMTEAAAAAERNAYETIRTPEVVRCLQALDVNPESLYSLKMEDLTGGTEAPFEITALGGAELSPELQKELQQMLLSVYAPGYTMGFVMMDINSGKGICFNSDALYYSASSAKASFIVSLIKAHPEVLEKDAMALSQVTVDSDNDQYYVFEYEYGQDTHLSYAQAVGVDLELDEGGYADVSAEDLTRLWLANYDYFLTGEKGETVGALFETPSYSAVRAVLMDTCQTRSKSGWIAGMLHNSSIDAGIVYAEGYPYVLAVMSDFPHDLEDLYETVELLDRVHAALE